MKTACVAAALFAWSIALPAAAQEAVTVQVNALKWKAGPLALPTGAQTAVLVGDPAKEGPYTLRIKLPAGFKIAPHTHPNDENLTVIAGTFHLGLGDKFDDSKAQPISVGGFVNIPRGLQHYGWAEGETIFQLHSIGPAAFNYVNAGDDPRKT